MSGIAGILALNGAPADTRLLRRMTEFLSFRGPDARETWSDGAVGFGNALLRTATQPERQPASLDGWVWITADARLDGRAELLGKLRSEGGRGPDTASDAELILRAYSAWGEACLEHLLGEFAFALWDGRRRRLWCVRDPLGVRPFYYARTGASLVFSNTLDCVRAHPDVSDQLNDLAIADFLLFSYNQEPATTSYAQIQRLPPAHTLTVSDGTLHVSRYWSPPDGERIRYKRAGDYVEHFSELLRSAVADRLRTARAGVLMSGGLDSTSVAAVARQEFASRGASFDLRAYTVDYRPLLADEEADYACLTADALGIPLHILAATTCVPFEHWERTELHTPEPVHEPLAALQHEQLRRVAERSRVALTGDGGDVLLHRPCWPYLVGLGWRGEVGRLAAEVGRYVVSCGRIPPLGTGLRSRLRRWLGRPEQRPAYPAWLNRDLERRLDLRARWDAVERLRGARRQATQAALMDVFWPAIFESQDAGATRVPLELTAPFFDLRVVNFLLAVPPLPWCAEKELLRLAMRGVLPEPVRKRPKARLAGDPLPELWKRRPNPAAVHPAVTPALAGYVDLERLPGVTDADAAGTLWLNLRPLSLNYWLQSEAEFEYKRQPKDVRAEEGNSEERVPYAHEEAL